MDKAEVAWAGGLFEGEGCFTIQNAKYSRATLSITDFDTMERFAQAVGVGKIYGPYVRPSYPTAKPLYTWVAVTFEDVQHVAALLWFGLGTRRREQVRVTLEAGRYSGQAVKWATCKNGHAWTEDNIIRQGPGGRFKRCRTCRLAYNREWKRRQKRTLPNATT